MKIQKYNTDLKGTLMNSTKINTILTGNARTILFSLVTNIVERQTQELLESRTQGHS